MRPPRDRPARPAPGRRPGRRAVRARLPTLRRSAHPGLVPEYAPPARATPTQRVGQEHLAATRARATATRARATGGRAVAVRHHNVHGPGMPRDTPCSEVASRFRSALARGEPPRVLEEYRPVSFHMSKSVR